MVIATLAIIGTPLLFDAAAAADEFSFELSTNAPVTAQGYSNTDSFGGDGTFVNSDMIGSPDKKTTCPVPPQKKKSPSKPAPKPESAAKPGAQIITHVCSPIITINMPQGTYFHPSQSSRNGSIPAIPSVTVATEPPSNPTSSFTPTRAPDNFKVKFKDLFEVELTTHSTKMLGVLILAFVLFAIAGAYYFHFIAERSSKSKAPWVWRSLVLLALAVLATYLVMNNLLPPKIKDTTIDRIYIELLTAKASPATEPAADPTPTKPQPTSEHIEAVQTPVKSSVGEKTDSEIWEIISAFVAGAIFSSALFFLYLHTKTLRSSRALPLKDLHLLEDEVSKTLAATNNFYDHPEVKLNSLLNSINQTLDLLEPGDASRDFTSIQPETFFIRANPDDYGYLNSNLRELYHFLSTRHKNQKTQWQNEAFQRLAEARQHIFEVCSIRPADEYSGFK